MMTDTWGSFLLPKYLRHTPRAPCARSVRARSARARSVQAKARCRAAARGKGAVWGKCAAHAWRARARAAEKASALRAAARRAQRVVAGEARARGARVYVRAR